MSIVSKTLCVVKLVFVKYMYVYILSYIYTFIIVLNVYIIFVKYLGNIHYMCIQERDGYQMAEC